MVRIALIGTSQIAHTFAQAARMSGGYTLEAVYSRDKTRGKKFAENYGISKVTENLDELSQMETVDAVYIASPNSCHYTQAKQMLNGGKHVLCEKPAVPTAAEFRDLVETAGRKNVIFMEAMRTAFDPGIHKLEELIKKIGPIRRATLEYGKYSSRYDAFKKGEILNAFNPALANAAVMDIGVYAVYAMVRLFGKPEQICGFSIFLENGMEGLGTILARYPGMISEVLYSKITDTIGGSQIQGELGNILIDRISEPEKIILKMRNQESQVYHLNRHPNPLYDEAVNFERIVKHRDFVTAQKYQSDTEIQLGIIEELRRQTGISF